MLIDEIVHCFGSLCVLPLFCYLVLYVRLVHLDGEERANCFALTVSLMSYGSQCSVALSNGVVG